MGLMIRTRKHWSNWRQCWVSVAIGDFKGLEVYTSWIGLGIGYK